MNQKKFICTYFDSSFLPRGLALYYSIKRYHKEFDFFVLTFDKQTHEYLSKLNEDNIKLISIEEYESYFQTSISKFEDKKQYYFTATPNICLYLIENYSQIDVLLYLDADVYLFNSLDPLYYEFGDSSIAFCPHRVHPVLKFFVKHYGKYNIGVNLFRNSESGLNCLKDWKNDCDNWYPNKPGYPLKFFSDQIFLDSWENKYNGVKIIENIGINVCYWNAVNYTFKKVGEGFFVNNKPLIIYHFSSLRKESDNTWNAYSIYGLVSVKNTLLEIYIKYINQIESFGLSNKRWEKINHRESIQKRFSHFILKLFINEKIVIR
ncbi:MAG: hypothetical protein NT144_13345 [Bacteroidia bacterium]|nr:hypothetical protein [Bacteroidia bacterium]